MWLCCWSKHTETVVGNNTIVMEAIWWQFAFIYCWELWKDKWKDESKRIMGIQNEVQIRLKVISINELHSWALKVSQSEEALLQYLAGACEGGEADEPPRHEDAQAAADLLSASEL